MTRRRGFTLVELVVVVLILGILATIALPKIVNNSATAADNAAKSTLATIRDAIELYRTQNNGSLPRSDTEANFIADLDPFIRGSSFPIAPAAPKNAEIEIVAAAGILQATAGATKGWKYSSTTGEFIINSSAVMSDGTTQYDDL